MNMNIIVASPIQSLNLQTNNIIVPVPPDNILAADLPAVVSRKRNRGERYVLTFLLLNNSKFLVTVGTKAK
jgi:hypothetical protein